MTKNGSGQENLGVQKKRHRTPESMTKIKLTNRFEDKYLQNAILTYVMFYYGVTVTENGSNKTVKAGDKNLGELTEFIKALKQEIEKQKKEKKYNFALSEYEPISFERSSNDQIPWWNIGIKIRDKIPDAEVVQKRFNEVIIPSIHKAIRSVLVQPNIVILKTEQSQSHERVNNSEISVRFGSNSLTNEPRFFTINLPQGREIQSAPATSANPNYASSPNNQTNAASNDSQATIIASPPVPPSRTPPRNERHKVDQYTQMTPDRQMRPNDSDVLNDSAIPFPINATSNTNHSKHSRTESKQEQPIRNVERQSSRITPNQEKPNRSSSIVEQYLESFKRSKNEYLERKNINQVPEERRITQRFRNNITSWYDDAQIERFLDLRLQEVAVNNENVVRSRAIGFPFQLQFGSDVDQQYKEQKQKEFNDYIASKLHNTINSAVKAAQEGKVVLLPINLGNNHWIGGAFVKSGDEKFRLFYADSLSENGVANRFFNALKPFFLQNGISEEVFELYDLSYSGQQKDGHSCGPYTVENLTVLAQNIDSLKKEESEDFFEVKDCLKANSNSFANAQGIRNRHTELDQKYINNSRTSYALNEDWRFTDVDNPYEDKISATSMFNGVSPLTHVTAAYVSAGVDSVWKKTENRRNSIVSLSKSARILRGDEYAINLAEENAVGNDLLNKTDEEFNKLDAIIASVASKFSPNPKVSEVVAAIKYAKSKGGATHRYEGNSGFYEKDLADQTVDADTLKFYKTFSARFQKECAACGLITGRTDALEGFSVVTVGMRLTFLPDELLRNYQKLVQQDRNSVLQFDDEKQGLVNDLKAAAKAVQTVHGNNNRSGR